MTKTQTIVLAVLATIVVAVAMGAGSATVLLHAEDAVISPVEVFGWDTTAARLDTTTGEILVFNGDLHARSGRGQWIEAVHGVTSGATYLDLQEANGAWFLVDVVTGDTWILRRDGAHMHWEPVTVFD